SGLTARSRLLARRGGRDIKRNIAKLPLMERTGWWFKINRNVFEPDPPPRLRHQRKLRCSLSGAAAPPGQEGRGRRARKIQPAPTALRVLTAARSQSRKPN